MMVLRAFGVPRCLRCATWEFAGNARPYDILPDGSAHRTGGPPTAMMEIAPPANRVRPRALRANHVANAKKRSGVVLLEEASPGSHSSETHYPSPMPPMRVDPAKVMEFEDARSFYAWLGKHWNKEKELWIKIHKVRSGLASITPAEAIDVALCWGWIDGIRKGLDEKSFLQRYTPRGKRSVWSQVNIANVERLTKSGKMKPPGLAHVSAAKADGRWDNAYRMRGTEMPADLLAAIRAEPKALATYETLSSQNRFALAFRLAALKTEAGRKKRIAAFVDMLKRGQTIHPNGAARPPAKSARRG